MNKTNYSDVVGHDDIKKHLINAAKLEKVSHAYLFSGETGSGKKLLASLFATALTCERHTGEPCNACPSCRKAMTGNNPDIITVVHEKPNLFSVDEVRQQIVDTVAIKPYEARYKVYIIADVEKMNAQAQNALLKTIEEPPAYAVLLLLTSSPDSLLPTIRSRCVHLDLKTIPDADIKAYLMAKMQLPEQQAKLASAFALGNVGRAIRCASDSEFTERMDRTLRFIWNIGSMRVYDLADTAKSLAEDKENISDVLETLTLWFRDVLLYKASESTEKLVLKKDVEEIRKEAGLYEYDGLGDILDAIDEAGVKLRANVNFELVMEQLFMTIRNALPDTGKKEME